MRVSILLPLYIVYKKYRPSLLTNLTYLLYNAIGGYSDWYKRGLPYILIGLVYKGAIRVSLPIHYSIFPSIQFLYRGIYTITLYISYTNIL